MSRLAAAIAAASLFGASTATAQSAPATSSVNQAVANTLKASVARNYPGQDDAWHTNAVNAIQTANSNLYNATCGAGKTWLCMAIYLEIPNPTPLGKGVRNDRGGSFVGGGGSFGGGGATTGSWDDPKAPACSEFDYRLDPAGNLVIPSLRLKGGGPITYDSTPLWSETHGDNYTFRSDSAESAVLYRLHRGNLAINKQAWQGAWYIAAGNSNGPTKTIWFSAKAYYNNVGQLYNGATATASRTPSRYGILGASNANGQLSCPPDGAGSSDFDFYQSGFGSSSTCTWYAKNFSLSSSGYAYPDDVSIPLSFALTFPRQGANDHVRACPVDPDFIRNIAQKLWDKGKSVSTSVPQVGDVASEDVRTGGKEPQIEDIGEQPTPTSPSDNAPAPIVTSTPTPTPTDPGETVGDPPSVGDPVAPEIDWWPDLPTISLSFGNPECPTYDMSVPQFGWEATLDSHCPLIEANRAAIAVVMMLMFSVGSILIVLRA